MRCPCLHFLQFLLLVINPETETWIERTITPHLLMLYKTAYVDDPPCREGLSTMTLILISKKNRHV